MSTTNWTYYVNMKRSTITLFWKVKRLEMAAPALEHKKCCCLVQDRNTMLNCELPEITLVQYVKDRPGFKFLVERGGGRKGCSIQLPLPHHIESRRRFECSLAQLTLQQYLTNMR